MRTESDPSNVMSIYAPDENKPKEVRESFFGELEDIILSLPSRESIIVLGDFNARIGSEHVPGIMQRFNEEHLNNNGKLMINCCSLNGLSINNAFFAHKLQHKYTFSNTQDRKSTIDYILTNKYILPSQILDVRTLNSANVGSDHGLLLGKIKIECTSKKKYIQTDLTQKKIELEALRDVTVRELYQKRLEEKIQQQPINESDSVDVSWEKLKSNIKRAALEATGTIKQTSNQHQHRK